MCYWDEKWILESYECICPFHHSLQAELCKGCPYEVGLVYWFWYHRPHKSTEMKQRHHIYLSMLKVEESLQNQCKQAPLWHRIILYYLEPEEPEMRSPKYYFFVIIIIWNTITYFDIINNVLPIFISNIRMDRHNYILVAIIFKLAKGYQPINK